MTATETPNARLERMLAAPTLGAWRRAHGITTWCPEARHMFAVELAQEAIRRATLDRLDGLQIALDRGATPAHIAARLRHLANQLDPPARHQEAA